VADIDASQRVSPLFRALCGFLVLATVVAAIRALMSPDLLRQPSVGLTVFAIAMCVFSVYMFGFIAGYIALTGRVPSHVHMLIVRCSGDNRNSRAGAPPNNRMERPREP
jgi:hypothetical protein